MNSTDDNVQTTSVPTTGGVSKEHEPKLAEKEGVAEITSEMELPKEVEEAGVTITKETIELPPDVKKLGVTPTGPTTPLTTLPPVQLPISDQQVVSGLHAQLVTALRWLAVWCLRKLKKAHIALKLIHGKFVRVRS